MTKVQPPVAPGGRFAKDRFVIGLFVLKRGWPRPLVVHAARWAALCNMMRLS